MEEFFAAIQGGDRQRVRALLAERPDALLARSPDGATPVPYAKYMGQREVLEELLAAAPALDAFEAAAVGLLPALERALHQAPASLHAWSADGWTALHLACFFGHLGCAQWLVQQGRTFRRSRAMRFRIGPSTLRRPLAGQTFAQSSSPRAQTRTPVRRAATPRCTPPHSTATRRS